MSEINNQQFEQAGSVVPSTDERYAQLAKIITNEALIEGGPSLDTLDRQTLEAAGGSIYYGTGLTTPKAISVGLPFDVLGMMLTAEKLRQAGNFDRVYHHIADTHAKTNEWIDSAAVDEVAERTMISLESIKRNLGLDAFEFIRASSFDEGKEYQDLLRSFSQSEEHEYVRREMADMEWYRSEKDVRLKVGWIIQASETEMGFDERRFDREYLKFHPHQMSFVYTKPGRTFDTSRPKASPYISVADEQRLVLGPNVDVASVLSVEKDPNLGGAKKHLQGIVRLYESLYGSLGRIGADGVTFESKLQTIIDKCFSVS